MNVRLGCMTRILGLPGTHARRLRQTISSRDVTNPTRPVPLILRPAKVCPTYWIGTIRRQSIITLPTKRVNVAQGLFNWVQSQDCSPDTPAIPQNASGPHRYSPENRRLRRQVINLASPSEESQRLGAGLLRLEECQSWPLDANA